MGGHGPLGFSVFLLPSFITYKTHQKQVWASRWRDDATRKEKTPTPRARETRREAVPIAGFEIVRTLSSLGLPAKTPTENQ